MVDVTLTRALNKGQGGTV